METILFSIIIPIGKKLGKKWIDRFVDGLDQKMVDLLNYSLKEGSNQEELLSYVSKNPDKVKEVENKFVNLMKSEEISSALATILAPERNAQLKYYILILKWIMETSIRIEKDVVLKGFFNGKNYLSSYQRSIILKHDININIFYKKYIEWDRFNILIKKFDSEEEMHESYLSLNEAINLNVNGSLENKKLNGWSKVSRVFPRWIQFREIPKEYLPDDSNKKLRLKYSGRECSFEEFPAALQQELKINSYGPLSQMIASFRDLLRYDLEDLEDLKNVVLNSLG